MMELAIMYKGSIRLESHRRWSIFARNLRFRGICHVAGAGGFDSKVEMLLFQLE